MLDSIQKIYADPPQYNAKALKKESPFSFNYVIFQTEPTRRRPKIIAHTYQSSPVSSNLIFQNVPIFNLVKSISDGECFYGEKSIWNATLSTGVEKVTTST
jgi:hypothetical protein